MSESLLWMGYQISSTQLETTDYQENIRLFDKRRCYQHRLMIELVLRGSFAVLRVVPEVSLPAHTWE